MEACANAYMARRDLIAGQERTLTDKRRKRERERERERESETRAERKTKIDRGKPVDASWHTTFACSLKLGTRVDVTALQTATCNAHAPGA